MPLQSQANPVGFINTKTSQRATEQEIRSAFKNTSFPVPFVAPPDYAPVFPVPQPSHNPLTHAVREINPERVRARGGDGTFIADDPATADNEAYIWEQRWEVVALPQEQVDANHAAARLAKWEAIKAERDRRKYLGVKVGAHWFHSDDPSRIQQLALAMMGTSIPAGLQWKTLTLTPPPVFVTMTPALAQGIFQATAASDAAIFAAAETHRLAMEASSTPESYDFSGGWPVSIEEAA